jgi:hypothetical protein
VSTFDSTLGIPTDQVETVGAVLEVESRRHMLGAPSADSMIYSNVEQESIEFVRYSLTPDLSPLSLARFEENAGRTNTSLVRLEDHAAYGTERTPAAVRIAAS